MGPGGRPGCNPGRSSYWAAATLCPAVGRCQSWPPDREILHRIGRRTSDVLVSSKPADRWSGRRSVKKGERRFSLGGRSRRAPYRENARWVAGPVLYLTLNFQGWNGNLAHAGVGRRDAVGCWRSRGRRLSTTRARRRTSTGPSTRHRVSASAPAICTFASGQSNPQPEPGVGGVSRLAEVAPFDLDGRLPVARGRHELERRPDGGGGGAEEARGAIDASCADRV